MANKCPANDEELDIYGDRVEIDRLKKEKTRLEKENKELKKENEGLRHQFDDEHREKEKIKNEYERYRARHPETVGVKHGKPYIIRSTTKSQEHRRPGARPGHKPSFRPVPKIDSVCQVPVTSCPYCGGKNLSRVQEERTRIIEDIPPCQPVVTQYVIERRYCRDCRRLVETPVTDALPNARLGLRAVLTVVWLKVGLRMTEEAIPKVFKSLFGLTISEGEVILIMKQVAEAFGPFYGDLIQAIREAPARNMAKTTWRIDGENVWLWTFVTKGEALFRIALSRKHEVPLEVLGPEPKGIDGHDRFSAYKTLAKKTGKRPQQLCWAHILADSKELTQFYGEDGEYIHQVLKGIYAQAKSFDHKGTEQDVEELCHTLEHNLQREYRSHRCYRFARNLMKERESLFTFVTNLQVDSTNNAAERALRPCVVARKISGGNRSTEGAATYEVLTSVLHTLHLRDQDILIDGAKILRASYG